ncbi:MAG: ATP-binding protein [Myxococcaceae bacterium]
MGVLLPLVLGLVVAVAAELRALRQALIAENVLITTMTSQYAAPALAFEDRAGVNRTMETLGHRPELHFAVVYDLSGKVFSAYQSPGAEGPDPAHPPFPEGAHADLSKGIVEVYQPVSYAGTRYGTLHLRSSTRSLSDRIRAYLWGLAAVALGVGVFSLGFAFALQRVISRPIFSLLDATRTVTERGEYTARAAKASDDEIGALADGFNTMIAEIDRRQQALRRSEEALKRSLEELAHTQDELVRTERLAAVGELAAVMAHEVRNPLGAMFNSLENLRRYWEPPPLAAGLLAILREEAERLNCIVEDLLDFARPNPPQLSLQELAPIIASAVEVATCNAPAGRFRVRLQVGPELPPVPMDERMIRQVLLNLVINAVQAMPGGGEIRVLACQDERGGKPWARVNVEDSGPGMPPETAARLFEPFFTTKASGTGLGLAVVRRFVEAHHGDVSVRTGVGQGSDFTVWLPLQPQPGATTSPR